MVTFDHPRSLAQPLGGGECEGNATLCRAADIAPLTLVEHSHRNQLLRHTFIATTFAYELHSRGRTRGQHNALTTPQALESDAINGELSVGEFPIRRRVAIVADLQVQFLPGNTVWPWLPPGVLAPNVGHVLRVNS